MCYQRSVCARITPRWTCAPPTPSDPPATPALSLPPAGVILLSKEYVRKTYPMEELRILLQRWQEGDVQLVPVLYGATWAQLRNMRKLYDKEAWCVETEKKPSRKVLDEWAGLLQQLQEATMIRPEQVRHLS